MASLGGLLVLAAAHVVAGQSAPNAEVAAKSAVREAPRSGRTTDAKDTGLLPEVTVEGQRNAIEPQVRAFVNGSLYLENDEGPARWYSRVCPAVVGLSHDDGEFTLARLSEIARAAGVPLDGEHCTPPNLYVFATANPAEFLKRWGRSLHWRMFGDGTLNAINTFINTPRPVRVWYNSMEISSDGAGPSADLPPGVSGVGGGLQAPVFKCTYCGSRITRGVVWSLTSAIVVVDKTQLQGLTRGQLADYIGMYAFSRLKTNAHYGNAPTILGLFDTASVPRPRGLTAWDEAFLDALYRTDPKLIMQRLMMVTRMVHHIVPESPTQPEAQ